MYSGPNESIISPKIKENNGNEEPLAKAAKAPKAIKALSFPVAYLNNLKKPTYSTFLFSASTNSDS